jgi:hypothetical protein
MPEPYKTFHYKEAEILIASEALRDGSWRPQWWLTINGERTRYFDVAGFSTEQEADAFAEMSARDEIDRLFP